MDETASRMMDKYSLHDDLHRYGQSVNTPRMVFVQDALPFFGGAERLLSQALKIFPGTPVYTLVHNRRNFIGTAFEATDIHTSFINRLPGAQRNHRIYLPLYPLAVDRLDLSPFDLILSFSYAAAHGILSGPSQIHIAYYYTPLRQAYNPYQRIPDGSGFRNMAVKYMLQKFQNWDLAASGRPDHRLAISSWVADLVWRAYQRPAQVIYPPVEVERFYASPQREGYYICVSRLEPHKRLDILIQAFNRLGLPLIIVGDGSQRAQLQRMANANIRFLLRQTDEDVARLLSKARAFVHAAAEDFGIALVEAQAAGCPVIAFRGGGASEIVIQDFNGCLYAQQDAESLMEAVLAFESHPNRFSAKDLRDWAQRFSAERFRLEFAAYLQAAWNGHSFLTNNYEPITDLFHPALIQHG